MMAAQQLQTLLLLVALGSAVCHATTEQHSQPAVTFATADTTTSSSSSNGTPSHRRLLSVLPVEGLKHTASFVKSAVQNTGKDPLVAGTSFGSMPVTPDLLPLKAQLAVPQALRTMAPGLLGSLPKGGDIKLSEYAFPTQTKITDRLEQLKQPLQMANKMGSFGLQVGALIPALSAISNAPIRVPATVKELVGDAVTFDEYGAQFQIPGTNPGAVNPAYNFDATGGLPAAVSNSQTASTSVDSAANTISNSDAKGMTGGAIGTSSGESQSQKGSAKVLALGNAKSVKGPVKSVAVGRSSSEEKDAMTITLNKALNAIGSSGADTLATAKAPDGQANAAQATLAATLLGNANAQGQVTTQTNTGNSLAMGTNAALSGIFGDANSKLDVDAASTSGNVASMATSGSVARSGTASSTIESNAATTAGKATSRATNFAVSLNEGGSYANSKLKTTTASGQVRTSIKIGNSGKRKQ